MERRPLHKTPFPGHCFVSIKKLHNLEVNEEEEDQSFQRNSLSQPLCHYQGSCNRFQEACLLSIKTRHPDLKLPKLNPTQHFFVFLIFFLVLMDRVIASENVAIKEAKKDETLQVLLAEVCLSDKPVTALVPPLFQHHQLAPGHSLVGAPNLICTTP